MCEATPQGTNIGLCIFQQQRLKNMPYKEYVLHSNLLLVLTSEMTHDSSLWKKYSKKIEDYYNAQNKFTLMNSLYTNYQLDALIIIYS